MAALPSDPDLVLDTQLKCYEINPVFWDEFLIIWPKMVALRKRLGFEILFALIDKANNRFTWAVSHPGDFDEATKAYYEDPDRVELEIVATYLAGFDVTRVSRLAIP